MLQSWIALIVFGWLSPAPPPMARQSDQSPSGMVAFFAQDQCPPGWNPAQNAQGRLILGVTTPSSVGVQVGSSNVGLVHGHSYSTTVTITERHVRADHGGNHDGAHNGTYTVPDGGAGAIDDATAAVPFVLLTVCQKQ